MKCTFTVIPLKKLLNTFLTQYFKVMKTKKIKIISLYELEFHSDLWEYLDLENDERFQDDPMILFEGDPDMIKEGGYIVYFMDVKINDTLYIIVSDDSEPELNDCLESFFKEDFDNEWEYSELNNWESFWQYDNIAIAYRGGKGYVYSIWHFIKK